MKCIWLMRHRSHKVARNFYILWEHHHKIDKLMKGMIIHSQSFSRNIQNCNLYIRMLISSLHNLFRMVNIFPIWKWLNWQKYWSTEHSNFFNIMKGTFLDVKIGLGYRIRNEYYSNTNDNLCHKPNMIFWNLINIFH